MKHGSNWRSVRESSLCILKALLNRIVAIAHSNLFISLESWLSFISIFRSFMSVTVTGSLETLRFNLDLILSRLLAPVSSCLTISGLSTGIRIP